MVVRTRYGTKVTIPYKPRARGCIEYHVIDTKNKVTTLLFDQEEIYVAYEPETQVDRIPNTLLDKWATKNVNIIEEQVE